jgi:hypothetical protein
MLGVMEEALWLAALAFIAIGTPALILKLTMIWFVRTDATKARLRLLALSIGGCSLAGIVTIACYVALSQVFEPLAADGRFVPRPFVLIATVALLVGLVAAIEFPLWRGFALRQGVQSIRTKAAWLLASNAWVAWAVWLMTQYREFRELTGAD